MISMPAQNPRLNCHSITEGQAFGGEGPCPSHHYPHETQKCLGEMFVQQKTLNDFELVTIDRSIDPSISTIVF